MRVPMNQASQGGPPNAGRSALYISRSSMDDPIGLYCLEECVPSLRALPHGFDARLAVPLPGEEPAELGETPPHLAEWRRGRRGGSDAA